MKFSAVVPIYNDAELALKFCDEFKQAFDDSSAFNISEVELIFVNDGSPRMQTTDTLKKVVNKFSFVKVIELSRNFGQHIALSAGYAEAKGEYVGMLNVDRQDPPSELIVLLNEIEKGEYDIVYGLVDKRKTNLGNRLTSGLFNKALNYLTQSDVPSNVATIRIMNRKFLDAYNSLTEKSRFLPGLETWLGFEKGYIPTKHQARVEGKSSYNFKKRLKMAVNSIISFSDYPLKLVVYFGSIVSILGFLLAIYTVITQLFFVDYLPGYSSTIVAIVFFGGIQILVIGLAALYIGRILREVQNRPLYIIKNKINF